MGTLNPGKVKVPSIEHNGGTTNRIDHLTAFKAQMSLQTGSKGAWCKFFHTTLKRLALTWFIEIRPGSISDFASLEAAFKQTFIAGRRHRRISIKRFNEEYLKVSDLQVNVAFTALMLGLHPSSVFKLKLAEEASTLWAVKSRTKFYTSVRHMQDPWGAKFQQKKGRPPPSSGLLTGRPKETGQKATVGWQRVWPPIQPQHEIDIPRHLGELHSS